MNINMDGIMKSNVGEVKQEIRVSFKKTVYVRQYETEVIEAESSITLDRSVSGIERMLISSIEQAQLEYEVYCNLASKGFVTQQELNERRSYIESSVAVLKNKAETIENRSFDYLFQ